MYRVYDEKNAINKHKLHGLLISKAAWKTIYKSETILACCVVCTSTLYLLFISILSGWIRFTG